MGKARDGAIHVMNLDHLPSCLGICKDSECHHYLENSMKETEENIAEKLGDNYSELYLKSLSYGK